VRLAELEHLRVAVWGYGREGRAALAALHRRFPRKPLTLICNETEAPAASIDGVTVQAAPPDAATLAAFDVIVKSPGISPYKPPVPEAQATGLRFTSGTALWFAEYAQARTICVTGTKGKSTVSALIAHILRASGRRTALAGNIGLPLLDLLDPPVAPDWWVIELSSFQARDFAGAPTVAVINNLYEEHLDWHGTRERYLADKLAIGDAAHALVVNAQPELLARGARHPGLRVFGDDAGWHAREDGVWRGNERVLAADQVPLPGRHNVQNVCAALAALEVAGEDAGGFAQHVATFKALPHRLQSLGVRDGIEYVNDSISTTPYATIEALRSLRGRAACVLVGGFDRGVNWKPFVDFVSNHHCVIVTMGANGAAIADLLGGVRDPIFLYERANHLEDALVRAKKLVTAAGVILLSPGAPSFDRYHDYAERGREFARLAGFDPAAIAQIEGLGIA
jgi:UDP-N-acetylmuramoylalanine--D-glutamate ligase